MLESIHIRGYRSLRDFRLRFGGVTVVTGQNGVGKSNLYRALAMIQRMADGRFAEAIADEGGMPGMLWAGRRRKDEALRILWNLADTDFEYEIDCGLIPTTPGDPTRFRTDPDVKSETLRFSASRSRVMAHRKGPVIELRNPEGKMETSPLPLFFPESMLSEVRDANRFPALAAARETFLAWRFYHQFRSDADSPMRRPRVGFWSPVLTHDGANLAATLQTIRESGKGAELDEIVDQAFPGIGWEAVDAEGRFQLQIIKPELKRGFQASELSDGTLRFFCLCAAFLTEKLPPLLILNEPETSLHADLIAPLADLISRTPVSTQLLIVTHSQALAREIAERREARVVELVSYEGETRPADEAGAKRVWTFGG
ncbi:AAA family ATPase [Luteolibacter yonseiensis]|uniref:AAA family ATPase n=1 Tax=Luteolibacter yonseiensis TaxID=1144680 RepID=A0A934R3P5_9BACT|nr:AAA family ATPase [Luteolibacter yonseiensis]MBK1814905.1 AAA family ATPase [Luteolibacter yonseiensis]